MASRPSWSACFSLKLDLLSGRHLSPGSSWGQQSSQHELGKPLGDFASAGQPTLCLFWPGWRRSIHSRLVHLPVTAPCSLLEQLFPSFLQNSRFSLILLEAFVISEPNYHNTDFKLWLEIIFRNRKGKIFCCQSRVLGYQQRNTGRERGSAPAHSSFLESYFPHVKL